MSRSAQLSFLVALALLAAVPGWAKHAEYIRPIVQNEPAAGLSQVVVINLVGPISIDTEPTDQVGIQILIHGGGMDQVFAQTLAQQLQFKIERIGSQLRITGEYPTDHFRDYGYPRMKSVLGIHGTDNNVYQGKAVRIRHVGNKKSVELWAEIRLRLPSSLGLVIRNIYGDVNLRGSDAGAAGTGAFDGFTDVGDFLIHNPRWRDMKLESDYGAVKFLDGFGAVKDIQVKTDFGGTYFYLRPGASGKILAQKDLGFLHNDFTNAIFSKEGDEHVMVLGDGHGTVVHVDMNVGSLHLEKAP